MVELAFEKAASESMSQSSSRSPQRCGTVTDLGEDCDSTEDGVLMAQFLVSVPFTLHITVEAEEARHITEEMVEDALMEQYGKYAEIDVRNGGGHWDVLDKVDE